MDTTNHQDIIGLPLGARFILETLVAVWDIFVTIG